MYIYIHSIYIYIHIHIRRGMQIAIELTTGPESPSCISAVQKATARKMHEMALHVISARWRDRGCGRPQPSSGAKTPCSTHTHTHTLSQKMRREPLRRVRPCRPRHRQAEYTHTAMTTFFPSFVASLHVMPFFTMASWGVGSGFQVRFSLKAC